MGTGFYYIKSVQTYDSFNYPKKVNDYQGSSTGITDGFLTFGSVSKKHPADIPGGIFEARCGNAKTAASIMQNDSFSQKLFQHFLETGKKNQEAYLKNLGMTKEQYEQKFGAKLDDINTKAAMNRTIQAEYYASGYTNNTAEMQQLLAQKYLNPETQA